MTTKHIEDVRKGDIIGISARARNQITVYNKPYLNGTRWIVFTDPRMTQPLGIPAGTIVRLFDGK
jgi:hypothetical protein